MRRIVVFVALILACGPEVDQGEPTTTGSGSGTTASDVASTGSETSSGVASTSSADDTGSSTTEAAPPVLEFLSANVQCLEAEGVELFVDVPLEDPDPSDPPEPPSGCGAPASLDSPGIAIWLSSWNGMGGTYSTDDENLEVIVTPGMEAATGTIVLEVAEPWLPVSIRVDVDDEGVPVQREIDLSMCLEIIPPVPCR